MEQRKFEEFLKQLGKEKKPEEEETKILSGAELREQLAKVLLSSIKGEVKNG